jgi:iron complex transport system substrate-binding protein
MRTLFAVCEPDPLAVATCSEKSFATNAASAPTPDAVSVRTLDMLRGPPAPQPSCPLGPRPHDWRAILTREGGSWNNRNVRIVSLCPSITETLVALGLGDALAGVTRYCIHPKGALAGVPRVGGTKNPDLEAIRAKRPDLVFCNGEENRAEDIDLLKREFRVDVTHPRTVGEIPALIRHFGRQTGREEDSEKISLRVEEALERVEAAMRAATVGRFRYVYLIWKDPWMTIGPRTYIADLLRRVGGSSSFEEKSFSESESDYPRLSESGIIASSPDILILPDEPYRFRESDAAYWRERLPTSRVALVSGDDFCWHGVRTLRGLEAASALFSFAGASGRGTPRGRPSGERFPGSRT